MFRKIMNDNFITVFIPKTDMIKNDFAWASKNRDQILTEWRKRYDGKTEKAAP